MKEAGICASIMVPRATAFDRSPSLLSIFKTTVYLPRTSTTCSFQEPTGFARLCIPATEPMCLGLRDEANNEQGTRNFEYRISKGFTSIFNIRNSLFLVRYSTSFL